MAASCIIFYLLAIGLPSQQPARIGMLALLAFLACVEKISSILNMVAVEKDWVRLSSYSWNPFPDAAS